MGLTNGYSILSDEKHVADDESQYYLIFQPFFTYFYGFNDSDIVFSGKSKSFFKESIKIWSTSDNSSAPKLTFTYNKEMVAKFEENCLNEDQLSFNHKYMMEFFLTLYELNK